MPIARSASHAGSWRARILPVALAALIYGPGPSPARSASVDAIPGTNAAALAVSAPSVTETGRGYAIENLTIGAGATTFKAARVEVLGTLLRLDELERLLDPGSSLGFADRAASLSVSEIIIPTLEIETAAGGERTTTRLSGVTLRDIGGGRIGGISADTGTVGPTEGGPSLRSEFGRVEIAGADLPAAIGLAEPAVDASSRPLQPIYGAVTLNGFRATAPGGPTFRVGRIEARELSGRPVRDGWAATGRRLSAAAGLPDPPPGVRREVLGALAELLSSFAIGRMEASEIGLDPAPGDEADGSARIGRATYAGGSGEFALADVSVGAPGGRVRVAELAAEGLSFGPALATLADLAGRDPQELGPLAFWRLVPAVGLVRMAGLDVAGPAGTTAEPLFALGRAEIAGGRSVEGVPTDVRLAVENLRVPIATAAPDDPFRTLAELGYERIQGSLGAAVRWADGDRDVLMGDVKLDLAGAGAVTLRATLGNVTPDVFSSDEAIASVALLATTVRSLDLAAEDAGLMQRFLQRESARQTRPANEIRREWAVLSAMAVPLTLGQSENAKALGQAIGRFVAKPGRLSVRARARSPSGVGLLDLAGSSDPTRLLDAIDLQATAE